MTATAPVRSAQRSTTAKKRSKRWLRLVIPPVALLVLMLLGTVVYQWEQPDLDDADYLGPTSHAGIGAADLADRVRAAGVQIIPERKSADALVAASSGNATLLITTPQLVHRFYLRMLKLLPPSTRVVIIEPDAAVITDGLLPMVGTARSYVARTTAPGCDYAPAVRAGAAEVVRTRYGPLDESLGREVARCYADSLIVYQRPGSAPVTVVGSADPFRNDRGDERGNAELTTALLTGAPRLVWLDLHRREPPPGVTNDPGLAGAPEAPASLRPVDPENPGETDFPIPGPGSTARPPARGDVNSDDGDQEQEQPPQPPNPLWSAFPPWTYVVTAMLALGVIMLAVAMARRLGAPVVEPLPVVVRSSETALGRGRLYQRARARAESLQVLRHSAIVRLTRLLRLDADVTRGVLIEAVTASSGWPPPVVDQTLFGPPPATDADLVAAAVRLEQLVNAVTTEQPGTTPATQPNTAAPVEGDPR
ncbi:hypothetical protein Dvina_48540 [Dactylosporangium vinaceum]|uniref:DUF4350 domain-containing protein n=1 Tax=Dactylosporangium vinaceum TaxID=53362 RepID=A0ABV5MP10_9ACTN|nr:DUF4350 domain-containing protein [Dactylosporangium vinaceum]UAB95755.1 hypothetical protein Dvina_48540 [Dactylosporangium vinaceum]